MPISNTAPDQRIWVTRNNGGAGFERIDRDGTDTGTNQATVYQSAGGFVRPNDIVFDTVHGLYFVADSVSGSRRILQGNISDLQNPSGPPALTVLYSDSSPGTAGGQILGLALDVDAATGQGHVYFVNKGNFNRVSYDHDGTSATNQTPVLLAQLPVGSSANEIALDIDNHRAFVLSTASNTTPVEVPEGTPGAFFDEDSGAWFIFATDVTNNEIWQVSGLDRTDTSSAQTTFARLNFAGGDNGGQDLQDGKGLLQSIDIDPTTGMLYFTTQQINSGAFGETGGIYRYNVAAGTYETLYSEGNATDYSFEYIDVDPVSGRYYVSNLSFDDVTGANTSSVLVHGLSAGAPTHFASVGNAAGAVPQGLIVVNAPTLAGTGGATTTESAGAGSGASSDAVALPAGDAHDGDTAGQVDQLAGAQVRISAGFGSSPGHAERLTIGGTTSGVLDYGNQDISYSYNSGTGVMTLSGASTFANYENALGQVAYSISGDNPDNYGSSPTRTLSYSVFDGMLYSDENDSVVTIGAANDAPVNTTGGPVSLLETDPPAAITGLAVSDVDADPANDAIQVTLAVTLGTINVTAGPGVVVSGNNSNQVVLTGTQNALNATFSAMNGVTYSPGPSGVDTLTMTTDDLGNNGAGGAQQDSDVAAIITVINVNDPPTAPATNSVSTAEDTDSAATAIGASDPDNDTLTYSEKPGFGAANGTVTFDQMNGTFTYDPDPDFNGSDSFTVLIDDGNGGTAEQVVSVTVTPVNDAPTAAATNSVTTAEDSSSAATSIGANDVDGDTLTYSTKPGFGPANGSVSYNQATGTFTYTPAPNYNGSDSFTIVIDDGQATTEQVVSVTVTPVNDAPTAPATGSVTTAEDTASAAQAIGASDIDGDTLSYSEKAGFEAANGTVTFNAGAGTYTYTPDLNYSGPDSFTILISDGNGGTAEQVVSVNVTEVNDPPTGITGNLSAPEDAVNGSSAGTVVAQDPDSASFTYELVNDAGGRFDMDSNGNVTVADGLLLDYEQASSHTIRVKVTDNLGASSEFDTTVSVVDVLGEDVLGDARDNTFYGGAENDILNGAEGNDTLVGQGGQDQLIGGSGMDSLQGGGANDNLQGGLGDDVLNGGAGADYVVGGDGKDIYVLQKGEANGDTIVGFFGMGAADGDSILLQGYGAGTTFARIGGGSSTTYQINDNGFIETLTILATGQVHPTDVTYFI